MPSRAPSEPEELVDAAIACICEFGVRRTSLSDVAQRAGVSRATAYRAFGDKAGLLRAVAMREIGRLHLELSAVVGGDATLERTVRDTVAIVLAFVRDSDAMRRLLDEGPEELVDILAASPGGATLIDLSTPVGAGVIRATGHADALGVPVEHAAEWTVRVLFTFLLSPATAFADAEEIADLLLFGIARG